MYIKNFPFISLFIFSSSFPRLKARKTKGGNEDENDDRDMEMEAEELLNALNAAPLMSNHTLIPHYNSPSTERDQPNEVSMQTSDSVNKTAQSPKNRSERNRNVLTQAAGKRNNEQDSSLALHDANVFEVPALPKRTGKENITTDEDVDPYEFVPSQRTPKKGKKKGVMNRKKKNPKAKIFPIRNKGVSLSGKTIAKGNVHLSASINHKNQEDENENANSNKEINVSTEENRNGKAATSETHKSRNVVRKGKFQASGSKTVEQIIGHEDDAEDVESLDVHIDNTDGAGKPEPKRTSKRGGKKKNPRPLEPVVEKRTTRATNCPQGSQSSDGQMMPDSQPVQINRNHGKRVFATVYGKPKGGLEKSPPLDPQERVLDWLVSKTPDGADSDGESDGGKGDGEEEEDMDELPDMLQLTPSLQDVVEENHNDAPIEDSIDISQQHQPSKPQPGNSQPHVHDSATAENEPLQSLGDQGLGNTCPENVSKESPARGKKRKQKSLANTKTGTAHAHANGEEIKLGNVVVSSNQESPVPKRHSGRQSKANAHKREVPESIEIVEDMMQAPSGEKVPEETPTKRKTAKQRMEESLKEEMVAAQKEADAAAIKSDWELALELARQFGTAPEHLASTSEEDKRSTRRRKGRLAMETVPEQRLVRRTRHTNQEAHYEERKESTPVDDTIDIDSFETQDIRKACVNQRQNRGKAKTKTKSCDNEKPDLSDQPDGSETHGIKMKRMKPRGNESTKAETNIGISKDEVLHVPKTHSGNGSQELETKDQHHVENKDVSNATVSDKNETRSS